MQTELDDVFERPQPASISAGSSMISLPQVVGQLFSHKMTNTGAHVSNDSDNSFSNCTRDMIAQLPSIGISMHVNDGAVVGFVVIDPFDHIQILDETR